MMRVLVIDDEKNIRENIVEILELNGYEVFSAENGLEGLTQFYNFKPEFVLCDIMMPLMDGYDFLRTIVNDPNYKHIPIVFLSAKAEIDEQVKAIKSGATDFMIKPFKIAELVSTIQKHTN